MSKPWPIRIAGSYTASSANERGRVFVTPGNEGATLNEGATWNASAMVAAAASHAKPNKLPGRRILVCFAIGAWIDVSASAPRKERKSKKKLFLFPVG